MKYKLLYELWENLKTFFTWDKIYPLWRFILCFFSADFFIKFNFDWIIEVENFDNFNNRTVDILYFIAVFILIRLIVYNLLEIPLRLVFHGYVKRKVINLRKQLNQTTKWDKKRSTVEFISFVTPFFHKYLFRYGIISSNDLKEPIDFDFVTKEKEYNEGMKMLYRWILTIIHTLLVSIIVWKFYAIWFFVIIIIALIASIILALSFTFLVLYLDYLETLRLQLLKENKKLWK